MGQFEELERLVPPPSTGGTGDVDWRAIEQRMRLGLPADYKWLVGRYGPGSFGAFLRIYQPAEPRRGIDLEYQRERTAWAFTYLRDHGLERLLRFDTSQILAAGRSDNGDTIYWRTDPLDQPDQWTITVKETRAPEWDDFDGGLVAWLVAVLSRSHRVSVFTRGFPPKRPLFAPYPREHG